MKEDKTTIVEKNPYKYNGESLHISSQPKALQRIDNQSVKKTKKFYIACLGCVVNTSSNEKLNLSK